MRWAFCLFVCLFVFCFSIRVFFHGHWRLTGQQGKGGDHLLFHSTTSTLSRTFRHLFATLHVRWLSHIFYLGELARLGGLVHLVEMIFISRSYGIFYLTSIKKFDMSLEKDCFGTSLFSMRLQKGCSNSILLYKMIYFATS